MSDIDSINWFPGHMAKTRRMIEETVTKCDIIVEIVDARIPFSSRNPYLLSLTSNKPRIIVLNKSDLADPNVTSYYENKFKSDGYYTIVTDCRQRKGIEAFYIAVNKLMSEKKERLAKRNLDGMTVRVMVTGIPNCGKSTFINAASGRVTAKAENRPGVTKDIQIVHIKNGIDLYDMPGLLMPKMPDNLTAIKLAVTGAVGEKAFDIVELAMKFCGIMAKNDPLPLNIRYKTEITASTKPEDALSMIAKKRGFVLRGGELDFQRTAEMLIDEYRSGKLGRLSLDSVN